MSEPIEWLDEYCTGALYWKRIICRLVGHRVFRETHITRYCLRCWRVGRALPQEESEHTSPWGQHYTARVVAEAPGLATFMEEVAGIFKNSGAVNYLEMQFGLRDDELGPLTITIQRIEGKTPHELRVKAEAEIATLKRESEVLRMAEDYYKTGARQTSKRCERPRYVPKRISIPRTVRSDMPGPSVSVLPGEYDAHVNQYGAVSIKIADDSFLGIMLYEFDVLEWQENPALLTAEEQEDERA